MASESDSARQNSVFDTMSLVCSWSWSISPRWWRNACACTMPLTMSSKEAAAPRRRVPAAYHVSDLTLPVHTRLNCADKQRVYLTSSLFLTPLYCCTCEATSPRIWSFRHCRPCCSIQLMSAQGALGGCICYGHYADGHPRCPRT